MRWARARGKEVCFCHMGKNIHKKEGVLASSGKQMAQSGKGGKASRNRRSLLAKVSARILGKSLFV